MVAKRGMTKVSRKMVMTAQMDRMMMGYIIADLTLALRASFDSM